MQAGKNGGGTRLASRSRNSNGDSSTPPLAPRSRGLPPAPRADPVGGFMPGQHVADLGDAAVWAADHGQSLQCKGGPGAVPQEMLDVPSPSREVA